MKLKRLTLIAALLLCGLNIFTQERVTPKDKALLEQLPHDSSFVAIELDGSPGDVLASGHTWQTTIYLKLFHDSLRWQED